MAHSRILDVGQCGFDHRMIASRLRSVFEAEVVAAATPAEALEQLRAGRFDLVLVNRVGDRDGAPGIDLIRTLKANADLATVPVMLVSDHEEAQADAEAAGAVPGFGKSQLSERETQERLARHLTPSN
ncbi:MAG TPA: response regulator [Isosphaeraceae bacterium]|jgi:CheY-like chemotaxis protein|nr:response regulator [Isosphaeraceae bacterium]